jgi:hypothetical protein
MQLNYQIVLGILLFGKGERPKVHEFQSMCALVSLPGMVETPRLQAKKVFLCREATCHSGGSRKPVHKASGIPGCRIESGMTAPEARLKM